MPHYYYYCCCYYYRNNNNNYYYYHYYYPPCHLSSNHSVPRDDVLAVLFASSIAPK